MDYNIIATGSTGNAVLLGRRILIDCGVPYKMIEPHKTDLKLVLLTHIHGDHFNRSTIRKLAKERPTLRFCCCEWLVPELAKLVSHKNIDIATPNNRLVYATFCTVKPDLLQHDVPNCCWHIWKDGESAIYATDTGSMDGVEAKGYDLYLIEANHGKEELVERARDKLENGQFSYEARAANTHLSEEKALDWIYRNIGTNGECVFLHGHKEKGK